MLERWQMRFYAASLFPGLFACSSTAVRASSSPLASMKHIATLHCFACVLTMRVETHTSRFPYYQGLQIMMTEVSGKHQIQWLLQGIQSMDKENLTLGRLQP